MTNSTIQVQLMAK